MTCIVGLEHAGKVYIGGDSAGVSGYALQVRADEKVFTKEPFVCGFTSSFRMGQLLRYKLDVPEQTSRQSDHEFMCTSFADSLRTCLKQGGYAKVENGVETGGTFLIGYRSRLYYVGSDFQIGMGVVGYGAVGCGDDLAMGALAASTVKDPVQRITQALEIAAAHSAGVCGPFLVVSA